MGDLVKTIFVNELRRYVFREGMNLVPWRDVPNDARLGAAGSYPLYEWLTQNKEEVPWTPGDVDIYFVHAHNPTAEEDDDSDPDDYEAPLRRNHVVSPVRQAYNHVVRRWYEAFEREVLKEDPTSEDKRRSLNELTSQNEAYRAMRSRSESRSRRGDDFRVVPQLVITENDDTIHRREGFDIRTIRNFGVSRAKIKSRRRYEAIDLPIFSFIRWRDHRQTTPSLTRVLASFDIDVCQVAIEPNDEAIPADLIPYTITDGDRRIRPLSPQVADAILHRTASNLLPDHLTSLSRIQKYQRRGFRFLGDAMTPT